MYDINKLIDIMEKEKEREMPPFNYSSERDLVITQLKALSNVTECLQNVIVIIQDLRTAFKV